MIYTYFYMCSYISLYWRTLYFHIVSSCCLESFYFNLKGPLQCFFQGSLSGNDLSRLLFMWECLNYSLIFKRTVLVAIIFLVNRFLFFLYTLIILSHCLLASKLSAEKSIDNFMENFLHMMSLCLWMLSRFSL